MQKLTFLVLLIVLLLAGTVWAQGRYIATSVDVTITSGTAFGATAIPVRGKNIATAVMVTPAMTSSATSTLQIGVSPAADGAYYWVASAQNQSTVANIITPDKPVPLSTQQVDTNYVRIKTSAVQVPSKVVKVYMIIEY